MTKEKFIMSFSGGKDSILALYRMIQEGHEPVALLTTVKKNQEKSWTHGLDNEILHRISKSLDIPLLLVECDVNEYERKFEEALIKAKDMGATMCVFGDIDIELQDRSKSKSKNIELDTRSNILDSNQELDDSED